MTAMVRTRDCSHADIEARLWNWGRWAGSDSGRLHSCGSAERGYVPEREPIDGKQAVPAPVDVRDAELIERAVLALQDDHGRRHDRGIAILRLRYVGRWRLDELRAKLNRRTRSNQSADEFGGYLLRLADQVQRCALQLQAEQMARHVKRGGALWAGVAIPRKMT